MKRFKIKLSALFTFALAISLGAALFWVSQQVQMLERDTRILNEKIASEHEGMRVLSAEWDYLNRPDRIEALATKYLDKMDAVVPDNLLRDARAVPEPQILQNEDETPVLVSTNPDKSEDETHIDATPDARPIKDREESKSIDFNDVLKKATGDDE
jgi:hypothetical protein